MTTLIENDLPFSAVMKAVDGPLIITRNASGSAPEPSATTITRNPPSQR